MAFSNGDTITENNLLGIDGWIKAGETWTYVSANSFKISGDKRTKYHKGLGIWVNQSTGGNKYFYVSADPTYVAAPTDETTVTIYAGSDYTLANETISNPYWTPISQTALNFPDWFNWVPTLGGTESMTFTSTTINIAKFRITGLRVEFIIHVTGTTGGSASYGITFTTPINRSNTVSNLSVGNGIVYSAGGTYSGMNYFITTSLNTIQSLLYSGGPYGLGANSGFNLVGFYPY